MWTKLIVIVDSLVVVTYTDTEDHLISSNYCVTHNSIIIISNIAMNVAHNTDS